MWNRVSIHESDLGFGKEGSLLHIRVFEVIQSAPHKCIACILTSYHEIQNHFSSMGSKVALEI